MVNEREIKSIIQLEIHEYAEFRLKRKSPYQRQNEAIANSCEEGV